MALSTGKTAEVMFEKAIEQFEHSTQMLDLVDFHEPDGAKMQNAGNYYWTPVQQHAPLISGWDLTGQETGIIEETYPTLLGTPSNDFVKWSTNDLGNLAFLSYRLLFIS